MNVLFRVDGGTRSDIAMGHIYRSCLIANEIKKFASPVFVSEEHPDFYPGHQEIVKRGFHLHKIREQRELFELLEQVKPCVVVLDQYSYSFELLKPFVDRSISIISFDHFDESRKWSKYPLNPVNLTGNGPFDGLKYCVIPEPEKRDFRQTVRNIFLSFGGYDHNLISVKVVKALVEIEKEFQIQLVVGASFPPDQIRKLQNIDPRVHIFQNPSNFNTLLSKADIALIAGGLTFFQALSEGIPSIVICQYQHQLDTVSELQNKKAFISLGLGDQISKETIKNAFLQLFNNLEMRESLHSKAIELIDGRGLSRVVEIIETLVKKC